MKPPLQLLNKKIGRLLVVERLKNRKGFTMWRCICDCGNERNVLGCSLGNGNTKSCGCLGVDRRREATVKHGMSGSGTYQTWAHMVQRCTNPKRWDYKHYGGRGISIFSEWLDFSCFLRDMGERPPRLTLDRINNSGNYEPGNCRWATRKEQSNNSRVPVVLTLAGKSMNIAQWADELGVNRDMLYMRRFRGWPVERILAEAL